MASKVRANLRRVALRRAVRAAIVPPATFAVALLVIRDVQVATFALFGCFALLVLADFGGRRRPRAIAYASATLAGAALLVLGTSVSPSLVAGGLLMLVIGFAIAVAGAFGGYAAAAQSALLLAFVLAVTIPAGDAAIPGRLAGWMMAGAVSTLAGVFFWPTFERTQLRQRAATACTAAAELVALRSRSTDGAEYLRKHAPKSRRSAPRTGHTRCDRRARPGATGPSSKWSPSWTRSSVSSISRSVPPVSRQRAPASTRATRSLQR